MTGHGGRARPAGRTGPVSRSHPTGSTGPAWIVAVDTGGTYTDAVAISSDGLIKVAKVPSTPADPGLAFERAVTGLAAEGVAPGDVTDALPRHDDRHERAADRRPGAGGAGHDRGVPRRPRLPQRHPPGRLRPGAAPAARAGAAAGPGRGGRAAVRPRRGADPADGGGDRPGGGRDRGAPASGGGGQLPVQLPRLPPRGRAGRGAGETAARRAGHRVLRGGARVPRVPQDGDRRAERRAAPGRRCLPGAAAVAGGPARRRRAAADHAVQRRVPARRAGRRRGPPAGALRPRGRRRGSGGAGRRLRPAPARVPRHGRHLARCVPGPRRRAAGHPHPAGGGRPDPLPVG